MSKLYSFSHNSLLLKPIYRFLLPVTVRDMLFRKISNPYSELELKNEIVFIHIPKTAGNAVIKSLFGVKATGHDKAVKYAKFDEEKFNSFFKFCFVRNPWDRMVSAFHYLKQGGISRNDIEFANEFMSGFENFEDFIYSLRNENTKKKILNWIHFTPQYEFTCNSSGELIVDYCGRYERLGDDYEYLKNKLGIEDNIIKVDNKSNHRAYWNYYNNEMIEIVREIYSKDIEMFGYKFPYEKLEEE